MERQPLLEVVPLDVHKVSRARAEHVLAPERDEVDEAPETQLEFHFTWDTSLSPTAPSVVILVGEPLGLVVRALPREPRHLLDPLLLLVLDAAPLPGRRAGTAGPAA